MNPRERSLLVILLTVLVGGAGLFLYWNWFHVPLRDYNAKIRTMQEENEQLEFQQQRFLQGRKKLLLAKLKSLPATGGDAASEYSKYLSPILHESGLFVEEVTPSPNPVEMKPSAATPGIKKVGHQIISFQVHVRGELNALVKALERMQKSPYEHRIKALSIDRMETSTAKDAGSKLNINMIIEALIVAKTESKPGIPPGIDARTLLLDSMLAHASAPVGLGQVAATVLMKQMVPQPPPFRYYSDIAKKNIFVGAIPAPPKVEKKKKSDDEEIKPPPELQPSGNVPEFIRLVQTVPDQKEAFLLNLYYKKQELRLRAKAGSGYDIHTIIDEDNGYVFFRFKVLRVEPRLVYLQIKDKVYSIHMGQTLADAVESPVSILLWDDLKISDAYDEEFAEQELAKDKKGTKTKGNSKTPSKGGNNKGGNRPNRTTQ